MAYNSFKLYIYIFNILIKMDELKRHPNPLLQINDPPATHPHLYVYLIYISDPTRTRSSHYNDSN